MPDKRAYPESVSVASVSRKRISELERGDFLPKGLHGSSTGLTVESVQHDTAGQVRVFYHPALSAANTVEWARMHPADVVEVLTLLPAGGL